MMQKLFLENWSTQYAIWNSWFWSSPCDWCRSIFSSSLGLTAPDSRVYLHISEKCNKMSHSNLCKVYRIPLYKLKNNIYIYILRNNICKRIIFVYQDIVIRDRFSKTKRFKLFGVFKAIVLSVYFIKLSSIVIDTIVHVLRYNWNIRGQY